MAYDVFVSYSSKDKAIADGIVSAMEQNNISCWYAPRDIKPSEDWGKAIANAIQGSRVFLMVFSDNANQSQHVLDELLFAINMQAVILPFRIENLEPEGAMKLHLSSRHWLDAFEPSWEAHLKVLIKNISVILDTALDEKQILVPAKIAKKTKKSPRKSAWITAGIAGGLILTAILAVFLLQGTSPLQLLNRDPDPALLPIPDINAEPTLISPMDGMVQVYIPSGSFFMGSELGVNNERPVHMVDLDGFWMDEHEVTNAQFIAFLNEQGNQEEGGTTWFNSFDEDVPITLSEGVWLSKTVYSDHPVVEVSWYGARAYCEWAGRRLPTEAEWEKAALGGLEGKKYPWGNQAPVCIQGAENGARFDDDLNCDSRGTAPIKSYAPNGYGLYDLAGNVWEWVNDRYWGSYYSISPAKNPRGPAVGWTRVLRGGGWFNDANFARSAYRNWDRPVFSFNIVGFRCASSLE